MKPRNDTGRKKGLLLKPHRFGPATPATMLGAPVHRAVNFALTLAACHGMERECSCRSPLSPPPEVSKTHQSP